MVHRKNRFNWFRWLVGPYDDFQCEHMESPTPTNVIALRVRGLICYGLPCDACGVVNARYDWLVDLAGRYVDMMDFLQVKGGCVFHCPKWSSFVLLHGGITTRCVIGSLATNFATIFFCDKWFSRIFTDSCFRRFFQQLVQRLYMDARFRLLLDINVDFY